MMINKIAESLVFLSIDDSNFTPSLIKAADFECNQKIFEIFSAICPEYFKQLDGSDEKVLTVVMQLISDYSRSDGKYNVPNQNLSKMSREHYFYFLEKLRETGIDEPAKWANGFCLNEPTKKRFDFMKTILSECVGHIINSLMKSTDKLKIVNYKTLIDDSGKSRKYYYIGNSTAMVETHYDEFLFLDLEDNSVVPTLVKTGWWEPWIDHLINAVLSPGMVALDAGANFGYHTNLIAKIIKEKGRLYSFEANPQLIPLLKRAIWVNGFSPRVSLFSAALGDKVGEVNFLFDREQAGGGGINQIGSEENFPFQLFLEHGKIHWGSWTQKFAPIKQTIAMTSIDSALGQEVDELDFIHMDIEGSEALAIIGGIDLIARSKNLVMILEWSLNAKSENAFKAFAFLESLKYKFYVIMPPHGENAYTTPPNLKRISLEELMMSPHCDIFVAK